MKAETSNPCTPDGEQFACEKCGDVGRIIRPCEARDRPGLVCNMDVLGIPRFPRLLCKNEVLCMQCVQEMARPVYGLPPAPEDPEDWLL